VLYSVLVSIITSLIIAILSLIRRKKPAATRANGETGNMDQVLQISIDKAAAPVIEPSFQSGRPALEGGPQSKATGTSPVTPGSSKVQTASDLAGQGIEGQPQSGKQAQATRWSAATKYVVGVGLILVLLFVIYLSRSTLGMIIFAALLAFVVQPLVGFFQRRFKASRGLSVSIAYVLVVLALILIPILVIPAVVQSINEMLSIDWQTIGQNTADSLEAAAQNVSSIPVIGPTLASTLDGLAQLLSGTASLETPAPIVVDVSVNSLGGQLAETLGKLAGILGPLISAVVSLIFMLLISLRMSLATHEIREAYPKLVPPAYKTEVVGLFERIMIIWSSFLRGQLSLMVIMGFLTYLLNLLLGTPYPAFLGLLAGLLEIIPNLGPVLATIPAVLLALVVGSSHLPVSNLLFAIIVILGYVLLSGLENQVIVPKVLGDAVSLHPLVVIIGCVVGGATFGILGVFLATPVISTGKEIFGYLYDKILEPPPEVEPPEQKPSMMETLKGLTKRIRLPFRRGEPETTSTQ
jgi:predicted PurR-regulated permease PerM